MDIPKSSIKWLVGRLHVGTPDTDIERDIAERCRKGTPAQVKACVTYALKCHRDNQKLYRLVMGGNHAN